jgi:uncharacterized membrane protein
MVDDGDLRLLVPEPVRRLPADLAALLALVGLTLLTVFLPGVKETPLRVVLGLPFVLFIPGYAFIAALFPEEGDPPAARDDDEEYERSVQERGIDGIERVALSFGLSIAVVPLIGLVLNFTPWGIRLVPIMVSVSGFTVVCAAVAAQRRRALPEDEQFHVPYDEWIADARTELFQPDNRADAALNVLLVLSILLATASVTYAVAVPKQGEQFTEFYILTEGDDGELVADDYPTEFTQGESKPLVVGVGNQEHETVDYTVVVELQRVRFERVGNNTTRVDVLEEDELQRFHPSVQHNETWHQPYNVTPTMAGENLRLTFLLYEDAPPADPTVDNAYRELHLWVNVTAGQEPT